MPFAIFYHEVVAMNVDLWHVLIFLLIGLAAGWIAGQLMKGHSFGLVGNLIVGCIGALLGGLLFSLLGISIGGQPIIGNLIAAIVGAVVLLLLLPIVGKYTGR
jgi:uncharacterized membrane protein YeaQ/YmgE (transglycosylase-associated protein family)